MRVLKTKRFLKDYRNLPPPLQARVDAKLALLANDISYPSLRVKHLRSAPGVHEGRVNDSCRFLFSITADAYVLLRVGPHDILDTL